MDRIVFALLLVASCAFGESKTAPKFDGKPKLFAVRVGSPSSNSIKRLGATAQGATLTVARQSLAIGPDGTATVSLGYSNSHGSLVSVRTLTVTPAQVVDSFGNVIASPTPAALLNSITSFLSQMDTSIGNAATAGMLNL